MRFYYVANARMPNEKAHGIQIAKMCEAFLAAGMDLELVLPGRAGRIAGLKEYYGLRAEVPVRYLPVLDTYTWGKAGYILASLTFMAAYLAYLLPKRMRREAFSIYTIDMDSFSSSALRLIGVPYMTEMHVGRPRNAASGFFFAGIAGVIAITAGVRDSLMGSFALSPAKLLVAPNGVDTAMFEPSLTRLEARSRLGLPSGGKIALYVGRPYAWKGLDTLIAASGLLAADGVHVIMLGGTADELRTVTGMEVPSSMTCVDARPYEEVPAWIAAADVALVLGTRKNEESFRFTSPMKAFEYLASERPVVASRTPALEDVLGQDLATFCEPDSPEDLTEAIRSALASTDEERIARGMRAAGEHSWAARAARILARSRQWSVLPEGGMS